MLIGHDWGGMIAWLVAICYPEMVTKLIVVNFPHPSVFTGEFKRKAAALRNAVQIFLTNSSLYLAIIIIYICPTFTSSSLNWRAERIINPKSLMQSYVVI